MLKMGNKIVLEQDYFLKRDNCINFCICIITTIPFTLFQWNNIYLSYNLMYDGSGNEYNKSILEYLMINSKFSSDLFKKSFLYQNRYQFSKEELNLLKKTVNSLDFSIIDNFVERLMTYETPAKKLQWETDLVFSELTLLIIRRYAVESEKDWLQYENQANKQFNNYHLYPVLYELWAIINHERCRENSKVKHCLI